MFPGINTGGGGLSNQSASSTGDQMTGAVTFGAFNANQPGAGAQSANWLPLAVLALVGFYLISKRR